MHWNGVGVVLEWFGMVLSGVGVAWNSVGGCWSGVGAAWKVLPSNGSSVSCVPLSSYSLSTLIACSHLNVGLLGHSFDPL